MTSDARRTDDADGRSGTTTAAETTAPPGEGAGDEGVGVGLAPGAAGADPGACGTGVTPEPRPGPVPTVPATGAVRAEADAAGVGALLSTGRGAACPGEWPPWCAAWNTARASAPAPSADHAAP
jgi:hypothetical protein